MAKLSAKKRAALKPSRFGLPEKARTKEARQETGNYPMPDKGHAISGGGFVEEHRAKPAGREVEAPGQEAVDLRVGTLKGHVAELVCLRQFAGTVDRGR